MRIKRHATSFQLIVFTAGISSNSYPRALSLTAPVYSSTVKITPTLLSLAERLWTDEALGLPWSSWCHIYILCVSTMGNKHVSEQLLGHSRRLALRDTSHSAVPTTWCVSVGKQVHSCPLPTQSWDVCYSSGFREPSTSSGTVGIWLCAKQTHKSLGVP